MKQKTRFAFNAYLQQLARLNGVAVTELASKFTVEPSVSQTLEDEIQQSAAFLTLINVMGVAEQSGQLLGLGVGSTIAGTTDTTTKEREPTDPTLMAVWTDGIGNTSGVTPGKTITERQAAQGLITNVLQVERALERCVVPSVPQKVYDAVVSFAFNVGTGNACSSTLVKLLNQKRWADACRQLPRWVYVKGVFNQGLDNRRAREMAWCLQGAGA